jgi:hypothetical protein
MMFSQLTPNDLRFVMQRTPKDVRELMMLHSGKLFMGGGFIRAIVAGETPNDIDLFGGDAKWLDAVATGLMAQRPGSRLHKTKYAITLITPDRMPIQFITRWTFDDPMQLVASFDFTVCQAAIAAKNGNAWQSVIAANFYIDLAGRRLVYTKPIRNEDAGGSMLRVIKYVKRGYSIQVSSLGAVAARLARGVRGCDGGLEESDHGRMIAGLLREVDPLLVVDGLDVVDDHEDESPAVIGGAE